MSIDVNFLSFAQQLSDGGYFVVVIPDLCRGVQLEDAVTDILSVADLMKKNMLCPNIGLLGFSVGSSLTLLAASRSLFFSAAVCYYGFEDIMIDISKIKIPLQCHFGTKDDTAMGNLEASIKLEEICKKEKLLYQMIYWRAPHSFMNFLNTNNSLSETAYASFLICVDFFQKNMRSVNY